MCPHGYHHSGSMATPALGTRDVRLHIVWIALWSHQSAQTASSERCIVQKVNVPQGGSPPNPRECSNCTYIYIYTYIYNTIYMYSGITSGRVLNGELLYTKILEVNLFAFAYRLFRRDFSPLDGTYCMGTHSFLQPYIHFVLIWEGFMNGQS